MLNVYPDNFSTNLIVPLGAERTLTIFEWFFREPERPDVAEKVEETVAFSDEIQIEDIGICEAVQRGLRSRTYLAAATPRGARAASIISTASGRRRWRLRASEG